MTYTLTHNIDFDGKYINLIFDGSDGTNMTFGVAFYESNKRSYI
jgi:hypothetical protein